MALLFFLDFIVILFGLFLSLLSLIFYPLDCTHFNLQVLTIWLLETVGLFNLQRIHH